MSQTKAQLISDLVQALAFTATASAPTNGMFLSASNTLAISTNSAQRLTVDSSGKVGIGETNVQSTLHVAKNIADSDAISWANSQLSVATPIAGNSTANRATIYFAPYGSDNNYAPSAISATAGTNGASTLKFFTNASGNVTGQIQSYERLRIDSSGKVGIGTTSPNYLLTALASSGSQNIFQAGQTGVSNGYTITSNGSALTHQWYADSGEAVRIDSNGRIQYKHNTYLIAKDSAGSGYVELLKANASNQTVIANNKNAGIVFVNTNTSELARIDSSGRLLIGTSTSPSGGDAHAQSAPLLIQGRIGNDADSGRINLQRGSAASNGSSIGTINFTDNSNNIYARLEVEADAATGSDDYPGRIKFSTTADAASSPTERMRIDSSGNTTLGYAGASLHFNNGFNNSTSRIQNGGGSNSSNLKFLVKNSGSESEAMRIDSSGNVAIGSTSAPDKLNVGSTSNGFTAIRILTSNTGNGEVRFGDASSGNAGYIRYAHNGNHLIFARDNTEAMRISSGGRVGIGTSTIDPACQAVIKGSSDGVLHLDTSDGRGAFIRFQENGTTKAFVGCAEGLITGTDQDDLGLRATDNIVFRAGSSEGMRLDSSGRVGIGTTSPASKLHIQDTVQATANGHNQITITGDDSGTVGESARIYLSAINATNRGCGIISERTSSSNAHALIFQTNSDSAIPTERMRIDSSGFVGIGETTPQNNGGGQLTVKRSNTATTGLNGVLRLKQGNATNGNRASLVFSSLDNFNVAAVNSVIETHAGSESNNVGRLEFYTKASGSSIAERMRITSAGKVGIGTDNPGQHLTIKRTGGQTQVSLISDTSESGAIYFGDTASTNRGVVLYDHGQDSLQLYTSGGERARITSGGYFKSSNSGSYYSSSNAVHEFNQSGTNVNMLFRTTHANTAATQVQFGVNRAATSNYWFLQGISGLGSGNDTEFYIRGDGNAFADGSWSGGGADYAEYFEWSDGNTEAEDRRGISVVLDGDKIREAVDGEEPIGVISGNPSVVGDADVDRWKGKYLRDDYGSYVLDEDGYRQLNPDYDSDVEYVQRENRPEWDTVGLMGKLRIRKGQITGSRWIKMRDVSSSVEEWLVR